MDKIGILKEYQKKVVDLSRRNRLLKYPKKARGIVFDMSIGEFGEKFGQLEEMAIDFIHRAVLEKEPENGSLFEVEQFSEENEEIYIPSTNPGGEKLLSVLSALRLDTKRKFEEHGLHTLFLTIGRVKWKQPLAGRGSSQATKNDIDYDSPLLLIPIQIKEVRSPRKRTVIQSYTDIVDITVNPVLLLLMELEYGVRAPKFENDFSDLSRYVAGLKRQIIKCFKEANIKCEISDDIQIGQYSFYGQQIYEDLKNNEEKIVQHEFVSSLCGNEQLVQQGLDAEIEPDELLKANEDFNVLDADVSQLKVIQKIISGNNLIVQGPPGTGKSQTIVNAVSNLLARGKTVLVVCEKQVALEVVYQRLKNVGLERLCLPLFHHNSDKKQFAKSIIADRDYLVRNYANKRNGELNSSLKCREESMECLRDYATALGHIVNPLGKTVHWVHGELARSQTALDGVMLPWNGSNPLDITEEEYRNIVNILKNLAPVLKIVSQDKFSHWKNIKKMHFSPDFMSRVQSELKKIRHTIKENEDEIKKLAVIQSISDIKYCLSFAELFPQIAQLKRAPFPLNMKADLKESLEIIKEIIEVVSEYRHFIDVQQSKEKIGATGSGKEYKIPSRGGFNFDGGCEKLISKDTAIDECREAYRQFNVIKNNLDFIRENVESAKIPFILEMPIAEVAMNRDILFLNPIAKRLNNWQGITSLKSSFEKLEPLYSVYLKIEEARKTINSWAILIAELDLNETQEIIQRFENSYHNFFRKLSGQYKKDCKIIEGWCNSETPEKYEEFLSITQALGNWIRSREKLQLLLDKFIESEIKNKSSLTTDEIPILYFQIKKIIEWLYAENQEELSPRLVKIIEGSNDKDVLRDVSKSFGEVQEILEGSWKIFQEAENLSVDKLATLQNDFFQYVQDILSLDERVREHIIAGEKSKTVSDLEADYQILNQIYVFVEKLKKVHPERLFNFENRELSDLFNFLEDLLLTEKSFTNAIALVNGLDGFLEVELSVNDILWFIEKIEKKQDDLEEGMANYEEAISALDSLFESKNCIEHLENLPFSDFEKNITKMISDSEGLEGWMFYRKYSYQLQELGQGWFLDTMDKSSTDNPVALFSQSLWSAWLDSYYRQNPTLGEFSLNLHSQMIEAFVQYEKEVLQINAERILRSSISSIKDAKLQGGQEEKFLLRQSQLKRAHKPVRQVVTQCNSHLQDYKPCWMMSPLTLSSYIPYGQVEFDVVIFDEASQMRVEHSLSSIARAKQVVIFGDENQLPPTTFFQTNSDDEDEEIEESQDFESVLQASRTILPAADISLLYHYRSKFEDLIAFSNHYIYNDELITFPNPSAGIKGVEFKYVADGVFDGGKMGTRRNLKEAKKVVELCVKCATDFPNKSLGVIAFSKSQEVAIRDTLIQWLKNNPNSELATKLDENSEGVEVFFIKNLESVQGDERDIIILSIGYGPDKNGKIYNRFGPINGAYGFRRLNVAVTRAKEKIICVSSMKAHDMNPSENSRGAKLLQSYLEYAEKGVQSLEASKLRTEMRNVEPDSEFELDVQNALTKRGYEVDRQIGASGFKIDLAILNPKNNCEYVLGIECDGASYHSSYSARINDRLRQEILEGLGWRIYRIWSQHWISHKDAIIEDIIRYIN